MNGTQNLATLESTSETPGMFWKLVLEKNGAQLIHLCQKQCIRKKKKKHEYSTYNKKEGRVTGLVTACVGTAI
jgi:hypothetical protein